ncbi:hypothetical protein BZA77DRAFT_313707 [Pyronema omphalodes]|nr:hypothetical protein BZA77DRAFT_313707 [Pyronema omphalodes]
MLIISTAFWLRSSVVSVLFSLISETVLFEPSYINLIFEPRELASVLAHVDTHCVTGIVLPPVDATILFLICYLWEASEEEICYWFIALAHILFKSYLFCDHVCRGCLHFS